MNSEHTSNSGGDDLKVLLVDDEVDILEQAKIFLEKEIDDLDVATATSAEEALDLMEKDSFDAVVADYQMPEMDGLEFLKVVREDRDNNIPFLIFTGKGREEVAIKALNLGADRYLRKGGSPKSQYGVLADAISREVEHWRSEREKRELKQRYKKIIDSSPDAILVADVETGEIIDANSTAEELFEMSREEIIGLHQTDLHPSEESDKYKKLFEKWSGVDKSPEISLEEGDLHVVNDSGERVPVEISSASLEFGDRSAVLGVFRDISDRMRRERSLRERVKELNLLYNLSKIEDPEKDVDKTLKSAVNLLPDAWQYPEVTCARISFDDEEYRTDNFQETEWCLSSDITIDGEKRGFVEVCYSEEKPVENEGPFLEEERDLIIEFADRLGSILEKAEIEKRLRFQASLLDQVENAVIATDLDGKITYWNEKAEEFYGWKEEEVLGENIIDITPSLMSQDRAEEIMKKLRNGETWSGEFMVKRKDGTEFPAIVTDTPLYDEKGELVGVIGITTDITERVKAEEEKRKALKSKEVIMNTVPDVIYRLDEEGRIVEWNDDLVEVSGYSPQKLEGMHAIDFFPDEQSEKISDAIETAFQKGFVQVEGDFLTKSGAKIPYSFTAAPIKDEDGEPIGLTGVGRDITKLKEAEKSLEDMREREETLRKGMEKYRQLTETIPDPILFVNKNSGEIMDANKQAENLFGMDRGEIIGKDLSEIRPEEEADSYEKLFEVEESKEMKELHVLTSNDDKVPVEIGTSTLELEGQDAVLGVFRNISERKKAEEREEFLHSLLRHDVRNKIQIIQGYNELLEDLDLSEEAKKYVSKGKKGAEEAVEIIEKVRHLREAQEEEIEEIRIDSAVREAVDQARPMAKEKGIEIEADCPGKGCEVKGGSLMNRVFSNIIENSVQHSGGSKIRIHGERNEDEVICIIEDDGKGIPDDKKDQVLTKGYTTDQARGTGLGMFLVKTLLDIYKGKIEVKDSELGGARFDVRLKKI